MSNIKDTFQPIIPNIVDSTMREESNAVKSLSVKNTNPRNIIENNVNMVKHNENYKKYIQQGFIYLLVVVIIILLVILIYQMYIYFTTDDIKDSNIDRVENITPINQKIY